MLQRSFDSVLHSMPIRFQVRDPFEIDEDDKNYLNYTLDKILYLPKSSKSAPKKAVDAEKGKIAAAAIGSIDFSL